MRKLPITEKEIELKGEWEGWSFTARMNPPMKVFGLVASGDMDKISEGLALIVRAWNFVDEEGAPMADPSQGAIGDLPINLVNAISSRYVEEMTVVPPA
jgi:hypothetical protein